MKKELFKNALVGFAGQLIILVLGLIVPRIMITNYGSDTNGVLSTITQIFTYMALLEAGIGQATKNLLYKPIKDNDKEEISKIFCVSQNYFKRLTYIYFLCVMFFSFLVPFIINSNLNYYKIALICFFQGAAGALSFYYIQTKTILLGADGKSYINNGINLLNQILSYLVKIIMAIYGLDIVLIQFFYFVITIAKVFVYNFYFRKKYNWLNYKIPVLNEKLKDRNSYILTEVAWTIFSSTDMIILSMFINSKMASVYSVYNMVFISLNGLLNSVYLSINYILGTTFHKNIENYKSLHDNFNSLFMSSITILMICSYFLIIPFVELYTNDVNDINYIYLNLPLLFCLVQMLSWSRYVSGNLTGIAGYAKQTSYVSLLEAILNVVLSIILVRYLSIVGVLLATVLALPIKVIYCNYLSDKIILKRRLSSTIKIIGINFCFFFIAVIISKYLTFSINNYFEFIKCGIPIAIITSIIVILGNLIVNKHMLSIIKLKMKKENKL